MSRPAATCHPDRPVHARGLCSQCYYRQRTEKVPRATCHPHRRRVNRRGECKPCYEARTKTDRRRRSPATCHPERRNAGGGLCPRCKNRAGRPDATCIHPHLPAFDAEGRCRWCSPEARRPGRAKVVNTCGHPDRPHEARGMCLPCYSRYRRESDPEWNEKNRPYKRRYERAQRYQRLTKPLVEYEGERTYLDCPHCGATKVPISVVIRPLACPECGHRVTKHDIRLFVPAPYDSARQAKYAKTWQEKHPEKARAATRRSNAQRAAQRKAMNARVGRLDWRSAREDPPTEFLSPWAA